VTREVTVVGGGLAGSELALQLADAGVRVGLIEMRPAASTPAHQSPYLAELVCSNSLKSEDAETSSGLLKRELRRLGCRLLAIAERTSVPAGHALAVDRELFARAVTEAVEGHPLVELVRAEQTSLELPPCAVIATGPLTSEALSRAIEAHFGAACLSFYDAISLSVSVDSIDPAGGYRASRYGKGDADYWNIPLDRDRYTRLVDFLRRAPKIEKRGFEETRCFEGCLPVEVLAARGEDALRFGPLKPKGLCDPRDGSEAYAVLQLRPETRDGTMYGLVGFQTRLARDAQREMLTIIPGFREPEILRWGAVHRNTFLDAPRLLDERQMSRARQGLFFSGQLVGVEGYMESIAHALATARNVLRFLEGAPAELFPRETLLGSLQRHCIEGKEPYQPMNVNFGLLPAIHARRPDRKRLYVERSLASLERFLSGSATPAPPRP
jgi:methylenetetrahydrofolate--tRNA-(uracil-5-)-methyltransferase